MSAVIGRGSARRLSIGLTILLFAVALAVSQVTNVWLMVGVAALLALRSVPWIPRRSPPDLREVAVGAAVGGAMLALTHALYPIAIELLPGLAAETSRLYGRLEAFPGPVWGAPVLVLAVVAEEVVFRGLLVEELRERQLPAIPLVALACVIYALPQLPSGTWLLPVVALCCGLVWTVQRLLSRGLTVPLVTHVVWSLGVFAAFPLV